MFYLCLLGCCSVGLGDLDVFISDFENSDSDYDHACKYVGCYYFFLDSFTFLYLGALQILGRPVMTLTRYFLYSRLSLSQS